MQQYLDLLRHVLDNGVYKEDCNGTNTLSTFGYHMRFNLADGFPLITTKNIHLESIIHELLWFLSGSDNVYYLHDNKIHIWDECIGSDGDVSFPHYGKLWRRYEDPLLYSSVDQIKYVIERIKKDSRCRKMIVNTWEPFFAIAHADNKNVLLPRHCFFQFYVAGGKLSCQLYQRSGNIFLEVPSNIASYALLVHMIAQVTGYIPGEFVHCIGDAYLYLTHVKQARNQLTRKAQPLPTLVLDPRIEDIDSFKYEHIRIQENIEPIAEERIIEIAAIKDEDIDFSNIPEQTEDFFIRAQKRKI